MKDNATPVKEEKIEKEVYPRKIVIDRILNYSLALKMVQQNMGLFYC
jgi:hypothetical protein